MPPTVPMAVRTGVSPSRGVRRTVCLMLSVLVASACLLAAEDRPAPRAEYRAAIDRLIAAVEDPAASPDSFSKLADGVPASWTVEAESGRFEISPPWIRRDLRALTSDDKEGTGKQALLARLRDLRHQLEAYDAPPPDASQSRGRLGEILARREFAGLHGPGWLERLRERVLGWLIEHAPSFLRSSQFSTFGKVVVYLVAGLALLLLVLVVVQNLRSTHRLVTVAPDVAVSARSWDSWLADARRASERGAWPDAVRLAYWTAISFLESQGLWPPDRARTPREYLRLLSADHHHHPALTRLTRLFESAWYGRSGADADTYAGALRLLEELGCGSR